MSSSEWDRVAASYAVNCTSFCAAHAQDVITSLSRTLSSEEPVTIVEVGCGSGAFALAYLRKYPRGVPGHSIVCIDVSPAMVEQAKKAVTITASDQCHTKFDFYVDDATALQNIPDDYANVVVSMFCVFFVPDQASALKSIRRVLVKDEASVFATSAWTSIPSGLSDVSSVAYNCNFQMLRNFQYVYSHNIFYKIFRRVLTSIPYLHEYTNSLGGVWSKSR